MVYRILTLLWWLWIAGAVLIVLVGVVRAVWYRTAAPLRWVLLAIIWPLFLLTPRGRAQLSEVLSYATR